MTDHRPELTDAQIEALSTLSPDAIMALGTVATHLAVTHALGKMLTFVAIFISGTFAAFFALFAGLNEFKHWLHP